MEAVGYGDEALWAQGYEEWAKAQERDYTTKELEEMRKECEAEAKAPAKIGNYDYNIERADKIIEHSKIASEISETIQKLIDTMYRPMREQEFWATVAKLRAAQNKYVELDAELGIEEVFNEN